MGGGGVAFNPDTRNTHFLEDPAFTSLTILLAAPGSAEIICTELSDRFEISDLGPLRTYVDKTLEQLQKLELIA